MSLELSTVFEENIEMVFGWPNIANKKGLRRTLSGVKKSASKPTNIPKGHFAVSVLGEDRKKRFIVPLPHLNEPLFQELLRISEEEFGSTHPMGGLTIPRTEDVFVDLISQLNLLYLAQ